MPFDSTLGGSESTSYDSVETADAVFANSLNNAAWTALTTEQKQVALMASTTALEALTYLGDRCSPSKDDADKPQALQWPRSGGVCKGITSSCSSIPLPIEQACAFLALDLHNNPNSLIPIGPGPVPEQGPVQTQKLGEMSITYFNPADQGSKVDPGAPIVLQKWPYLVDLMSCWLSGTYGSSKLLWRVRS